MEDNKEIVAPVQMFQNEPLQPGINKAEPGDLIYYIEKLSVLVGKHGHSVSATGWIVGFQCEECGSILVSYKNLKVHEAECGHTATCISEVPQTLTYNQIESNRTTDILNSSDDIQHSAEIDSCVDEDFSTVEPKPLKKATETYYCSYCNKGFASKSWKSRHEGVCTNSPQLHVPVHNYPNVKVDKEIIGELDKQESVVRGENQQPTKNTEGLADDIQLAKMESETISVKDENMASGNSAQKTCVGVEQLHTRVEKSTKENRSQVKKKGKEQACSYCHKIFTRPSRLKRHLDIHKETKSYACAYCSKLFKWEVSARKHQRKCQSNLQRKENLSKLAENVDIELGLSGYLLQCNAAESNNSSFEEEDLPEEEINSTDTTSLEGNNTKLHPKYSCPICGKRFNEQTKVDMHQVKHTGERPFECDLCGQRFPWEHNCTQHKSSCTGTGEWRADDCLNETPVFDGGVFNKRSLTYVCALCRKHFSALRWLKKHCNEHEENKCDAIETFAELAKQVKQEMGFKAQVKEENATIDKLIGNEKSTEVKIEQQKGPNGGKVQCKICNRYFPFPAMLKRHAVMHTGEKKFKCHMCPSVFAHKASLLKHEKQKRCKLNKKEVPSRYQCSLCKKELSTPEDFSEHACNEDMSNAKVQYVCVVCNSVYVSKSNLKYHMKIHTLDGVHKCENCGKVFTIRAKHQNHVKICGLPEEEKYMYRCSACPKAFKLQASLFDHERMHRGELLFKCEVCGKHYLNKHNLKQHMSSVHSGEKPFMCSECGKCFPMQSNLSTHLKVHEGKRDHKCEICGKAFMFKNHLTRHRRVVHTDVRNYQCQTCPKAFKDASELRRHEFTHTGLRPYKCSLCPMAFKTGSSLRYHEGTHTGFKEFECSVCHQKFSVRANMLKHKQNHPFTHSDAPTQESINSFMPKDQLFWNFPLGKF